MPTKSLLDVIKQTTKRETNSIITKILGRDKFIMLNMVMLSKLGADAACFLTFILDRADFLEKSGQIKSVEDDGLFIYRSDLTKKLGLSNYQQRVIERELKQLNILSVVEEKLTDNQTRNRYRVDLLELDNFLDKEEQTPLKN